MEGEAHLGRPRPHGGPDFLAQGACHYPEDVPGGGAKGKAVGGRKQVALHGFFGDLQGREKLRVPRQEEDGPPLSQLGLFDGGGDVGEREALGDRECPVRHPALDQASVDRPWPHRGAELVEALVDSRGAAPEAGLKREEPGAADEIFLGEVARHLVDAGAQRYADENDLGVFVAEGGGEIPLKECVSPADGGGRKDEDHAEKLPSL